MFLLESKGRVEGWEQMWVPLWRGTAMTWKYLEDNIVWEGRFKRSEGRGVSLWVGESKASELKERVLENNPTLNSKEVSY